MELDATSSNTRRFRRLQWRMLIATMFCYLFFYTGRQSFGFAIPGIESELGLSKAALGWVSAALLWAYGLGQFVNGNLGDKYGGRRMMSLGALLSCTINWVVSFSTSFVTLIVPWAVNGLAQSMGWAPGSRVLSNWWPKSERGKVYGAYVFAAGMASVLAFTTSILILETNLGWRWIFRLPVLLLIVGGITYFFIVRDRPEELGFRSPLEDDQSKRKEIVESDLTTTSDSTESSLSRYRHVLSNGRLLIGCIAIGFQSLARYGLIIWVPVYFLGENWQDSPHKWISVALPLGMALGAIVNGWLSDRIFHSNRSYAISLFLYIAAACCATMYLLPLGHPAVLPMLFLAGFFVYGPQSGFWALCPDLLGNKRAGTGTGVMNTFAYAFAGIGEPIIGWMIDSSGKSVLVFSIVATVCLCGGTVSLFIRR